MQQADYHHRPTPWMQESVSMHKSPTPVRALAHESSKGRRKRKRRGKRDRRDRGTRLMKERQPNKTKPKIWFDTKTLKYLFCMENSKNLIQLRKNSKNMLNWMFLLACFVTIFYLILLCTLMGLLLYTIHKHSCSSYYCAHWWVCFFIQSINIHVVLNIIIMSVNCMHKCPVIHLVSVGPLVLPTATPPRV